MKNWFTWYLTCHYALIKYTVHGMGMYFPGVHDVGKHDIVVHDEGMRSMSTHSMGKPSMDMHNMRWHITRYSLGTKKLFVMPTSGKMPFLTNNTVEA
jgi:hypothetical protein